MLNFLAFSLPSFRECLGPMKQLANKYEVFRHLQKEIIRLSCTKQASPLPATIGLQVFEPAFPNSRFPATAVHEFISYRPEASAATNGFIAALLNHLIPTESICLWISNATHIFPPALKLFGLHPHRFIFIHLSNPKDLFWTVEEALKCSAIACVVGELKNLSFTESRRLQLAVEGSGITGIIHRYQPLQENTLACLTRWKIQPLSSETAELPGVGFPKWQVTLSKVRNGRPQQWEIEWANNQFHEVNKPHSAVIPIGSRKTG